VIGGVFKLIVFVALIDDDTRSWFIHGCAIGRNARRKSPFGKWFEALSVKIATAIKRMEQGKFSNSGSVGSGVWESKIDYGPGYRIYYGKDGEKIIILIADGTKKRQQQDIEKAKEHWLEFKKRKGMSLKMSLTREFKDTIVKRAQEDPEFKYELLVSPINEMINGDLAVAKSLLRDYINANPQFDAVAKEMKKNTKSIQRMLGPNGNSTAENLTALIKAAQKLEGIKIEAWRCLGK
jgi:putative addiction module killer protein